LYIFHFTVHEKAIFDWGKFISIEISSQLSNFKKEKNFFMDSYLIFVITYFHIFEGLTIGKRIDCKINHVTVWYQALWRQKTFIHFYEAHNEFVTVFKKLLFVDNTSMLSSEATNFMNNKGTLEKRENYNVIRIFCSQETLAFLSYYLSDKKIITEVARKYGLWIHFFQEKRKKEIYPIVVESHRNCIKKHNQN